MSVEVQFQPNNGHQPRLVRPPTSRRWWFNFNLTPAITHVSGNHRMSVEVQFHPNNGHQPRLVSPPTSRRWWFNFNPTPAITHVAGDHRLHVGGGSVFNLRQLRPS